MKTVFEINDYRKACKFLQDKYDALGYERKDYYHMVGDDNHLTKTGKTGHGDAGLQYHHICEDLVPSLSDKTIATKHYLEHPEYQAAENMCYCNLLEHAWLHILITEANAVATDEDQEDITGVGGVRWMLIALNSIMSNKEKSWYSKADYPEINEDDIKGMHYNVNNIITDNKDQYLKVINRFCTSAFIRQRLNKTPEELAELICIGCKDTNIYRDILNEANSTKLFDWNVNAYADLENYLKDNQSALVYICTGGGKTTTGLEYLRLHGGHALVLGPGDTIKQGWESNSNVTPMNYQKFMNSYETLNWKKYTVIICDEAHHIKAERWGMADGWMDNPEHYKEPEQQDLFGEF